jgi:hypothetical protein
MSAWTLHQSKSLFSQIRYLMEHHPIATNSILTLHLWLAGDLSAQYVEHYKEKRALKEDRNHGPLVESTSLSRTSPRAFTVDSDRAIKSASYGGLVTGPLLAVWYPFLDRKCLHYKIPLRYGVWGAPVFKVLADEFIMDPPFISMFFAYMNLCEGGDTASFKEKLRSEFVTTWLTSLATLPAVMLLTFRYLPVYAAAPVANAIEVAWDAFLSYRNAHAREIAIETKKKQNELIIAAAAKETEKQRVVAPAEDVRVKKANNMSPCLIEALRHAIFREREYW